MLRKIIKGDNSMEVWVKILNFPNFIRFFLPMQTLQQCFNGFLVPRQKNCVCRYTTVTDIQREWYFINVWLKLRVLNLCFFQPSYYSKSSGGIEYPEPKNLKLTVFQTKILIKNTHFWFLSNWSYCRKHFVKFLNCLAFESIGGFAWVFITV